MNNIIKSFEESNGIVFGDLLSERIQEEELKIGLFTGSFFEYWRMYPETLEKTVTQDMTIVYDNLKNHFTNVYWPGVIDTIDKAEAAGKLFEKEQVDIVVYIAGTYCPDYMSIQTISHVKNAELIIFNGQVHKNINLKGDYEDTLRNSGLISISQLSGALRKMGWNKRFKVVVGTHDEQEVYREIKRYADSYKVFKHLQDLNIGFIGHVFRGMYDFEYDKTKLKGILGPNVINIQISHLLDEFENVCGEDVKKLAAETKSRFRIVGLDEDDIARSTRLYFALKTVIEKFRLDAICLLGQHYIEQKTGATSYLANMLFHEEGKYMAVTEGDIHGLIVMCIMNKLSGKTPLFAEWGEYDEDNNAILFMHHGFGDPNNAKSFGDITINKSPEQWGLQGHGFNMEFAAKPGTVTMAHIITDIDGYKMIILKGEALDISTIPCEEIHALIKIGKPVKEFIKELLYEGFSHHAIIGYGDMTEELGYIADFMGIKKVIY